MDRILGMGLLVGVAVLAVTACAEDAPPQDAAIETPATGGEEAPPLPPSATAASIGVDSAATLGAYLTDSDGRALYLFMADSAGRSTCLDACAGAWPPYTTVQRPSAAAALVRADLLGTIDRQDGRTQVTYNGWPLYHYASDPGPGSHMGQDVEDHGAEWYLVSPEGEPVHGGGEG